MALNETEKLLQEGVDKMAWLIWKYDERAKPKIADCLEWLKKAKKHVGKLKGDK